jgi:hypothetical protein
MPKQISKKLIIPIKYKKYYKIRGKIERYLLKKILA